MQQHIVTSGQNIGPVQQDIVISGQNIGPVQQDIVISGQNIGLVQQPSKLLQTTIKKCTRVHNVNDDTVGEDITH